MIKAQSKYNPNYKTYISKYQDLLFYSLNEILVHVLYKKEYVV